MATKVLAKRSAVQNKVPLTTDLSLGELALNTYDGLLYFKKSPGGVDAIVTAVTTDAKQTLTNKLLLPKVTTSSSPTTLSWNSDNSDFVDVTSLSGNLLISADSGSPSNGQKVMFRIVSGGNYTFSLSTVSKGFSTTAVTIPSSLTATTYHMGCIYNSAISKWEVVAFKGVVSSYNVTTGTSSQLLANNGSGGFSNVTIGTGLSYSGGTLSAAITSVTGTSPVSASTVSGAVTVSMAAASTSTSGYLTSTDWNTFNSKQAAGSYLTTVTADSPLTGSGTSASHLSIPAASTSTNGYLTSTDWNTFNSKQAAGSYLTTVTADSPLTGSGTSGSHLSIPAASSTVSGYLTSSDWTTFNSKGSGTVTTSGSPTTNYLPKFTGSTAIGNSQIYDNGTNVAIGTSSTAHSKLEVNAGYVTVTNDTADWRIKWRRSDDTQYAGIKSDAYTQIIFQQASVEAARFDGSSIFTTAKDMLVNSLTLGRGGGNSSTNSMFGYQAGSTNGGAYSTGIGYQALNAVTSSSIIYNTAVGYQASKAITTGSRNTSVGALALWSNTTGADNIGIGYFAGYGYTTGSSNIAVGNEALLTLSTNSNNTAVGHQALKYATGNYNTALGAGAAFNITTGNATAVGYRALYTATTATTNVALGTYSLYSTTGNFNTAVGYESLRYSAPTAGTGFNTAVGTYTLRGVSGGTNTGTENTAIGYNGSSNNTTGSYNTALGSQSLTNNQTGEWNTALGRGSLFNSTGSRNTAVGGQSLVGLTSGTGNVGIGLNAAAYMTSGDYNVVIGHEAYFTADNDYYNSAALTRTVAIGGYALAAAWGPVDAVAIGYNAGINNSGSRNISIGSNSAHDNYYDYGYTTYSSWYDTADDNIAIGTNALYYNTSGDGNVAIGTDALKGTGTGAKAQNVAIGHLSLTSAGSGANSNTAIGANALRYLTTGGYNTAIGNSANLYLTTGTFNTAIGIASLNMLTTGLYNVALGFQAGSHLSTTSSYNVLIGQQVLTNWYAVSNYNTIIGNWTGSGGGVGFTSNDNNIVIADGQGNARFAYDGSTHQLDLLTNGSSRLSIDSAGTITATGTVAVNASGGITTNQTTFPLVNTTATTVNFAGAATSLNIGNSSGITNISSAVKSGNGTFTKAGYATGDLMLDNGATDTPGLLMYYANNSNFGIDSYNGSFTVLSGQLLRFTNKLNESGGTVKAAIDTSGNLATTGFVYAGAFRAGQIIKDTMLSNTDFTVNTTTVATSTTDTDFITYSYTPTSATSYLIIHIHVADFRAASDTGGAGTDSYFSRIKVDGNEIVYSRQMTRSNESHRTGVLFPLTGRYTNSSTTAKSITVGVRRDSADDSITITNSATALWMRITEIAR